MFQEMMPVVQVHLEDPDLQVNVDQRNFHASLGNASFRPMFVMANQIVPTGKMNRTVSSMSACTSRTLDSSFRAGTNLLSMSLKRNVPKCAPNQSTALALHFPTIPPKSAVFLETGTIHFDIRSVPISRVKLF